MTQQPESGDRKFTPALGRSEWTGLYDAALRLFTRERVWRSKVLELLAPIAGEAVLDVGCGTGTLALAIKRGEPGSSVTGLDPDPEALALASAKASRAGLGVDWRRGFASDAGDAGVSRFDAVTCTLVLHQVPLGEKRAGLAAMLGALKPGGRLVLADYSEQRSRLMRTLFRLTVQRLDGYEDTQPNADGVLPVLLSEVGFRDVTEAEIVPTPSGSISIFTTRRAG